MPAETFEVPWVNGKPDLSLDEGDTWAGLTGFSVASGQEITPETTTARVVVYASQDRLDAMAASEKFRRVE